MTRHHEISPARAAAAAACLAAILFSALSVTASGQLFMPPDMDRLEKAFQQSVTELGPDAPDTLTAKHNLAFAKGASGDFAAATEMLGQVAEQRSRVLGPEHRDTLRSYADQANFLDELGDYVAARDVFSRVLETMSRVHGPDDPVTVGIKNNLALVLINLGEVAAARDMLLEVLEANERAQGENIQETLIVRLNLAYTLALTGDHARARGEYELILEAYEKELGPEAPATLIARNNLATNLDSLGMDAEALAMHASVLESRERVLGFDHPQTIVSRHNLAGIMVKTGDSEGAKELFLSALESETRLYGIDHVMSANTAHALGSIMSSSGETAQAIFFLKLAVVAAQKTRSSMDASDEGTRRSYLSTVSSRYQFLFDQLLKAGRREEALAVLELLKEDEMAELVPTASLAPASPEAGSGDGGPGGNTGAGPPDLFAGTPEEAAREAFLKLVAVEAELAALPDFYTLARGGGAGIYSTTARRVELEDSDEAARKAFKEEMANLAGLLVAPAAPAPSERLASLQAMLAADGGETALIYAVSAPETLHLVVVTPDSVVTRESPYARNDLQRMALDFRATVQDSRKDPRPSGKALYDALLKPVEADLEAAGAKALTLSLDGALRYVPLAALYDGERFLVERYPVSIFTGSTVSGPPPAASGGGASARAMGVTLAWPGFPALPGVGLEIEAIVGSGATEGILPGEGFLDAAFDRAALAGSLASDAPVVHVASHFSLDPSSLDKTELLLGDGSRLTLSELRTSPDFDFAGLDILALSACDTGSGARTAEDGSEVESLGELFQRAGASAVLATLLPVDDTSTPLVMREFYRLRFAEGKNKARALQGAQLLVMQDGNGSSAPKRGTAVAATGRAGGAAAAAPPWEGKGLSHPLYWSPYVIMGDWR
ncbi:MAG: CHAT domain-containing protein [Deltaproteobacteria bacterium]|jgi:CHAT domain-containing protein|nr:CHAT domain-containing protein [Deltaproteobacteria bacterium]